MASRNNETERCITNLMKSNKRISKDKARKSCETKTKDKRKV